MYVPMRGFGAGPDGLGAFRAPSYAPARRIKSFQRSTPPPPPKAADLWGCSKWNPSACAGFGEGPPLAKSPTGSSLFDAVLGGALGYALAPKPEQRLLWAGAGAAATGLTGSIGLWAMTGLSLWIQHQRGR